MRKRITDEKRIVIKFLVRNEIVIYISDKDVIIGKIAADNMISNKVVGSNVVTWYRLSLEQTFGFRRCFFVVPMPVNRKVNPIFVRKDSRFSLCRVCKFEMFD